MKVKNLLDFMRFKLCIFSSFVALSGYLLYNQPSLDIHIPALSAFFLCAGAYTYNSMADKEEDSINKRYVPDLSKSAGLALIAVFYFLGLFFSFIFSPLSIFYALVFIALGLVYTLFRVKRHLLIKNLYTGFGLPVLFLMGALNSDSYLILYYLLISIFFLIGSVISDLRDYEGDKITGIKTMPVYIGYSFTKKIVYALLLEAMGLVIFLNAYLFLPLLVFAALTFFFTLRDSLGMAHLTGGVSIISLAFWLIVV